MLSITKFECEAIIFGKGTGESILVRLSNKEWMIVDSCMNDDKKPAALQYLNDRNVDIENEVKLIVISHFHDDHIRGLAEIIEKAKSARVVISLALNTKEFSDYINALNSNGSEMAKTREISKIMSLLPSLTVERRLVYAKRDTTLFISKENIQVHSLSPSDNDVTRSNLDFHNSYKHINNSNEITSSARVVNPNHFSIVTRLYSPVSGNEEILLGSDLEVCKESGWDAVCEAMTSPSPNKIGLFKLPHHGSETGFHERTWNELINNSPVSVMTTYDSSSLPREKMIDTYKEKSRRLYCTSLPKPLVKKASNIEAAEKILKKMNGNSVKFVEGQSRFGYIAFTKCFTSDITAEVFLAAVEL